MFGKDVYASILSPAHGLKVIPEKSLGHSFLDTKNSASQGDVPRSSADIEKLISKKNAKIPLELKNSVLRKGLYSLISSEHNEVFILFEEGYGRYLRIGKNVFEIVLDSNGWFMGNMKVWDGNVFKEISLVWAENVINFDSIDNAQKFAYYLPRAPLGIVAEDYLSNELPLEISEYIDKGSFTEDALSLSVNTMNDHIFVSAKRLFVDWLVVSLKAGFSKTIKIDFSECNCCEILEKWKSDGCQFYGNEKNLDKNVRER